MDVGVVYPQTELGGDPRALDRFGRAVESMGFDHLLMYDHVVGAQREDRDPPLEGGPYNESDPFHDPFVSFAYLSGVTSRLKFFTGILILPQRQTVLVARQAADVDLLSGERLTLGVATGWNYVEYDALGESFAERGRKLDEQIPYLRRLWTEPMVSFDGNHHMIDRAALIPRPRRSIPIYCGGHNEVAFRRAARIADGFLFAATYDQAPIPGHDRIRELLRENGRDEAGFSFHYLPLPPAADEYVPAYVARGAARWRDIGATATSICTMYLGFTDVDQHLDYLAEVKSQLKAENIPISG